MRGRCNDLGEFVNCNIDECNSWLFEYACRYLEIIGCDLSGRAIKARMNIKYEQIRSAAIEYSREHTKHELTLSLYRDKIDEAVKADLYNQRKLLERVNAEHGHKRSS